MFSTCMLSREDLSEISEQKKQFAGKPVDVESWLILQTKAEFENLYLNFLGLLDSKCQTQSGTAVPFWSQVVGLRLWDP